ncbi:Glycosyltransferase Family 1 protein [Gigaspora rosea]|uniref:Glycosyltransferase Family 1 protein n=1 Tax=Gigaspora rosea TaxID=44941 RepID=A0A397W8Q5_9GLOM|nr:Glycosyltransferase Family 1 protein [Gigaspora rosea]
MFPRYLFSSLNLWHLAIFILLFINLVVKSQKLPEFIQRDSSLNRANMPKNILATFHVGGESHVAPMCEILKILIDRDISSTRKFYCKVRLLSSIPQIVAGEKSGFEVVANEEQLKMLYLGNPDIRLMPDAFNRENYIKYYNLYKQTTEEINADLLFCDHAMNYACFDLASKLEKPVVGFSSAPFFRAGKLVHYDARYYV